MATIRPSMVLTLDIDKRLDPDGELTAALKRSYLYIAPIRVLFHEEPDAKVIEPADGKSAQPVYDPPLANTFHILIRVHKPYWETSDPAAVELWDTMMDRWLYNITRKISNTIIAFNNMRQKNGGLEIPFPSLEYFFEGKGLVEVQLASDCSALVDTPEMIKAVRGWYNSGVDASSVERVYVPVKEENGVAAYDLDRVEARFADGTSRQITL